MDLQELKRQNPCLRGNFIILFLHTHLQHISPSCKIDDECRNRLWNKLVQYKLDLAEGAKQKQGITLTNTHAPKVNTPESSSKGE